MLVIKSNRWSSWEIRTNKTRRTRLMERSMGKNKGGIERRPVNLWTLGSSLRNSDVTVLEELWASSVERWQIYSCQSWKAGRKVGGGKVLASRCSHISYGLFTLPDTDSDSDSKLDGYIVLWRNCYHCTDLASDSNPDPNLYCTHFCNGYPYPDRDPSPCPAM